MWRPLINIINNKYLDTPECSQPRGQAHKYFRNERQLRRWRRLPLCTVPTRPGQARPDRKESERERETRQCLLLSTAPYDASEETTLSSLTGTHILTMGSLTVPLCSGWVASPCLCPLSRRLLPTSSSPSRFVFCQMFGLMMALMDGSHVSGSHLVIYLKTFQINRPQLSQSLSLREEERGVSFDSRIVQRGDFYRSRI